jgi:nicotinamide N-methyltransferase
MCWNSVQVRIERHTYRIRARTDGPHTAGVGLVGIVSTLAGASDVCISDYPAKVVLDNIKRNVKQNVPEELAPKAKVEGHAWGVFDDDFAKAHGHKFNRVLAADCFWMPWQHENLALSMLHFLSDDEDAQVLAIGGFHTGRAKLAAFFDVASETGLEVQEIYEEDAVGIRREWVKEMDGGRENVTERKKWLTIAVLRRAKKEGGR